MEGQGHSFIQTVIHVNGYAPGIAIQPPILTPGAGVRVAVRITIADLAGGDIGVVIGGGDRNILLVGRSGRRITRACPYPSPPPPHRRRPR